MNQIVERMLCNDTMLLEFREAEVVVCKRYPNALM